MNRKLNCTPLDMQYRILFDQWGAVYYADRTLLLYNDHRLILWGEHDEAMPAFLKKAQLAIENRKKGIRRNII